MEKKEHGAEYLSIVDGDEKCIYFKQPLGGLGRCSPPLVSTPTALPAQLLQCALEIDFCWPCNALKTTSAADW